jgi:ribosomal protein S12 methylthiotransferase accessory factor
VISASTKSPFADPPLNYAVPPAVLASLHDKDRLCPSLAGVGWIDGDSLQMRLSSGDLRIDAPRSLLRKAFELCDGTLTFNEILAKVAPALRVEFAEFLEFLLLQGALVDAIHLTQQAMAFGFQTTPIGTSADEALTGQIQLRFVSKDKSSSSRATKKSSLSISTHDVHLTPLDGLISQRVSTYTFDNQSIEPSILHQLLWLTGGIVKLKHARADNPAPHRTLASGGGMYLVRWIVVLQRAVGTYAPGVYDVHFPGPRQISLTSRGMDTGLLYRVFLKPWQLTFATGVLFAVADAHVGALRYRNRVMQYLFMEVGAALQNVGLAGPQLGVGSSVIGGYCEEYVKTLCGLDQEMILGSAIFGAMPSPLQQQVLSRMPAIDFVWSDSKTDLYPLPFVIARARLRGKDEKKFNTWGKDSDPRLAYVKAHVETIERQGMREVKNVMIGRLEEIPGAIDPRQIAAYKTAQYRTEKFPFAPYNPEATYAWVRGINATDGGPFAVIGDFVYGHDPLKKLGATGPWYTAVSSSGCGAGPSSKFAQQAGLLEVLERDAFMRHWLSQQPGLGVPHLKLSRALQSRVGALRSAGCEVSVQRLDAVAAEVALVSATHPERHFTCVAAAARFDLSESITAALDELESSVYTRLLGQVFTPLGPAQVDTPEDHTLLYAQRRYFRRAEAVLRPNQTMARLPNPAVRDLQGLIDHLAMQGLTPGFVDLTPQQHHIDQGRTPISVAKAVVPTLIPISFGFGREPRAMVPRLDRRSFFPHPFP